MRTIIRQSVTLPDTPANLFATYLDPQRHAAFTGAPVTISRELGAPFRAFNDMLQGAMLQVVESRLIVQSWRSVNFGGNDPDSTLILLFSDDPEGGRIDLIHLDVPQSDYDGVTEGWQKFYWTPWREHLENRA